jgi:tetrahydromethanopterin S-methyltransferase subunit G
MEKITKKEQVNVKTVNEIIDKLNELEEKLKVKTEREQMLGQRYG